MTQEQEQLAAIRESIKTKEEGKHKGSKPQSEPERDFEGGFGGQEDLEDRYVLAASPELGS